MLSHLTISCVFFHSKLNNTSSRMNKLNYIAIPSILINALYDVAIHMLKDLMAFNFTLQNYTTIPLGR